MPLFPDDKDLPDFERADLAMALCRMLSYNIGQLAYLNAKRFGLSRIFFGGFFIRGHPYTMETISFAIDFWSKARQGQQDCIKGLISISMLPSGCIEDKALSTK